MLIGISKEIKNNEYRVGITPDGVATLVQRGHQVMVETGAGDGIGFSDKLYRQMGATMAADAARVFGECDMLVKVKEPQPEECQRLRSGQLLFTYLHLAADKQQAKMLLESDAIAIAYETVTDASQGLPLLKPMSEVAGRMSVQAGAHTLEKSMGGMGVLLPGVPGVPPANVLVLGGGVVGVNAARIAMGMGARVTIMDISLPRLTALDQVFGPQLVTMYSSYHNIMRLLPQTDLVIGAVLIPGAAAPRLITRKMLGAMRPGAVIVDVAIDQGGCIETSKPTTHEDPVYEVDGVMHYCVTNMPGSVARTSTLALTNATMPYVLALADKGYKQALADDQHLRNGLNVYNGKIAHPTVAQALGCTYSPYLTN